MDKFEVVSGTLVCSDPCYELPTWCQGVVENVKKGTWVAEVEYNDRGERVKELRIHHKDSHWLSGKMERMNFTAGVDSGQFGFFDKDFYRNNESAKGLKKYNFGEGFDEQEGDEWYRACCALTLGEDNFGVLPNGAVSSTGYGDGSYEVFGQKDKDGEYVGFGVIFIDESEEDEEE
jgi:hypothetical protein